MKQIAVILILSVSISFLFAQTSWTGYLADKMCSARLTDSEAKAAGHTKECLVEEHCAKSGYGVITGVKYCKFDKKGDELAAALLKSSSKEKGFKVTVTGSLKKKKISVTDITEAN